MKQQHLYLSMNSQLDSSSTLSNSRRQPPLPRPFITQGNLSNTKMQHRPSIHQLNIGLVKNPSQTSLHSEHRRRSIEPNQNRNTSKERPNQTVATDNHELMMNRQNSGADAEIANELVRILRDENKNLKEQNAFLIAKVRDLNSKDKNMKEAIAQYESLCRQLKDQNDYLKKQVADLTEDAKRKVEEFGQKLSYLIEHRQSIESDTIIDKAEQPPFHPIDRLTLNPNEQNLNYQNLQDFNQYLSINSNISQNNPSVNVSAPQTKLTATNQNESLLEDLNNQFEALIYSCRVEKNPQKRKEIRKRLVELTYQMRALGSNPS